MKKVAAAVALLLVVGCTSVTPQPAPSGGFEPVSPGASPPAPDPQGMPGPGVLILVGDENRVPAPATEGQALHGVKPEVRQRIEAVFAAHNVKIERSNEAGEGYLLVQAPRGTADAATQAIVDDLRKDKAILAAELDLRQKIS